MAEVRLEGINWKLGEINSAIRQGLHPAKRQKMIQTFFRPLRTAQVECQRLDVSGWTGKGGWESLTPFGWLVAVEENKLK